MLILRRKAYVKGYGNLLANRLQCPQIGMHGKHNPLILDGERVVNYGVAHNTSFVRSIRPRVRFLNDPWYTKCAANKVTCLKTLESVDVPHPDFTVRRGVAEYWATEHRVFCRTLIKSSRGHGIVVANKPEEVVDAPLYTKAWIGNFEYRVHVFGEEVIDWVVKTPCPELAKDGEVNWLVRNKHNGWRFKHSEKGLPPLIAVDSIRAIIALKLDFGAVDVVAYDDRHAILEVNTAPGIGDKITLKAYLKAIKETQDAR